MADARPDYFPEAFQDQQKHDRRTPASMGGAAPVLPPAPVRAPHRPPADQAQARAQRRADDRQTRAFTIGAAGQMPASGPLTLDLGGPMVGYTWDLKQIMVGQRDMTAVPYPTGVTTLVFLRSPLATADNSATNCLSWTAAYPAQGNWGRHEANVEAGETVQVVVIGLAAGTWVVAGATVEQTAAGVAETFSV